MDEFIKDVLAEEDLQTVVARYCAEDFEHSGARGGNSLITGAAAALARGNGGEIISTEEAIRAHNQQHPTYIIPLNRVTRWIPSGLINRIAQVMVERHWPFNRFMGEFGRYVILYSSILSITGLITGTVAVSMMAAFLTGLMLTQGMSRLQVRGVNGRTIVAHSMDAGWAQPIEPPPTEEERRMQEEPERAIPAYPMPEEWTNTVNGTDEDKAESRYVFILRNFWEDPRHEDSRYYTSGLVTNRANIISRVETRDSKTRDESGYGWTELVVPVRETFPDAPLRCQAIRKDGTRCINVIHIHHVMNGGKYACFCGTHGKKPDKWWDNRADNWAVDKQPLPPLSVVTRSQAPKGRVVEKDVSDENKLRF